MPVDRSLTATLRGMDMLISELEDTRQIAKPHVPALPTILIVDDDDFVVARLQELMGAAGYEVRRAAGVSETLGALETFSASIVVADFNMAGVDVLELCRCVRRRRFAGHVYIMLFTVRDCERDILAAFDAGADDYVIKGTSATQFMARLRSAKRVLELEHSLTRAAESRRRIEINDALTGVYNRRYFLRHFGRELKRTQRYGGNVSLLLIEVDHFKTINDTYGHAIGDLVLQRLTRLLAASLRRDTDWCARLGRKAFAVVLEGAKLADACACAHIVRRAIADSSIETSAGCIRITVSIGVSGLEGKADGNAASVQFLLRQAKNNLYASVLSGCNRVTLSDSIDARAVPPSNLRRPSRVVLSATEPPGRATRRGARMPELVTCVATRDPVLGAQTNDWPAPDLPSGHRSKSTI
jgi:two-component system, cell cycle response regulator